MSETPWLLDLFCGAGGAAMGYHRAGFRVVGVDEAPQPNYPFEFVQDDATGFLDDLLNARDAYGGGCGFAAIHASPPCQAFTDYRRKGHGVGDGYPNLIPSVRSQLEQLDVPYVIENVEKARPELRDPVVLCGSMFGLDVPTPQALRDELAAGAVEVRPRRSTGEGQAIPGSDKPHRSVHGRGRCLAHSASDPAGCDGCGLDDA